MKNKNQQENWEEKLTQFLLSEEILFENEIGEGWIKISEGKQLTGEYQKIINKVAQLLKSEKEKWLNLTLERIKLKEKKVHYISAFLEMSHEKIRQEANEMGYNQAIEDLEKLKSQLKDEKLKVGKNKTIN